MRSLHFFILPQSIPSCHVAVCGMQRKLIDISRHDFYSRCVAICKRTMVMINGVYIFRSVLLCGMVGDIFLHITNKDLIQLVINRLTLL